MHLLDTFAEDLHRLATRVAAARVVARSASGSQYRDLLNRALTQYRKQTKNPPEWLKDIERRRHDLFNTDSIVEFEDHGRGRRVSGANKVSTVERRIGDVARASAPPHECLLLHSLIDAFEPRFCIELGTCLGISAAYQARALKPFGGELYSIEGGRSLADIAQTTMDTLECDNVQIFVGTFRSVLPDVLEDIPEVNFAFIDGHHDETASIEYYKMIRKKLAPGSLVVFDDLTWSPGMRKAWRKIRKDNDIAVTADLLTIGICVLK